MRRRRFVVAGVAALLSFLGGLYVSPMLAEEQFAPGKMPTTAEAAEQVLKGTQAHYEAGKATVEDVYRWSRRLMEAQQADGKHPKAREDHLNRLYALKAKAAVLYRSGSRGGDATEYYATTYYLLKDEAEGKK